MKWEVIIGLEIHAQLNTQTKAFCRCPNRYGAPPNTLTCPVCLGMPGALPVLSRAVVDKALHLALALDSKINHRSQFDRKNYFYPDLPKGYQISQFHFPFCTGGTLEIDVAGGSRQIGITRAHIEEDAGKSTHLPDGRTIVDMNRCGVPLIEIVSEPELRSPEEAASYVTAIRELLRFIGVCDGNMEQGSLRCDANVSVRQFGHSDFNERTEIKNLNSIRSIERALKTESSNQIAAYESGGKVVRSTLLWDDDLQEIRVMRRKEGSDDYRYFPEPDLVPLLITEEEIAAGRRSLPKLPREIRREYASEYGWNSEQIQYMMLQEGGTQYIGEAIRCGADPKIAGSVFATQSSGIMTDRSWSLPAFAEKVSPARFAGVTILVARGTIPTSGAKRLLERMLTDARDPEKIVEAEGLAQVSDEDALIPIVNRVLEQFPDEVQRYRSGKKNLMGHFVSEARKASNGRADPAVLSRLLRTKLEQE